MINIQQVEKNLKVFGKKIYDENLNRYVNELLFQTESLHPIQIDYLVKHVPLNPKYEWELKDIDDWYFIHFPSYTNPRHRRHIVYFNDKDYDHRLQCISLFQVIDQLMIVYQRSSDTAKMIDDFRFFVEIRNRYFKQVDWIQIVYGSLHTKTDNP